MAGAALERGWNATAAGVPTLRAASGRPGTLGSVGGTDGLAAAERAATELRISLLGPIEVSVDGAPVRLVGQKRLAVLAVLALRVGRVVSTDALIDALWGFDPPPSAPGTLQSHVSHVRRVLGPAAGRLLSRAPGYRLDLPPEAIDVSRFEALAAAGRAASAGGRPAQAAEQLSAALRLWRGPALDDLAGLEFAAREAARWDEARLAVVEDRVDADLALGRHGEVAAELGQLLAANPGRERLAGQLMLALYRGGRQADALQVFQDTRRRLIDELGIEPGRDLQALEEAILLQKPELDLAEGGPAHRLPARSAGVSEPGVPIGAHPRTAGPGGGGAPPPVGSLPAALERVRRRGPLVGRTEELGAVTRLVRDEHPSIVLLTGEPGIGKTRLAAEVAAGFAAAGGLVRYGRCDPEGAAPYQPLLDALGDVEPPQGGGGRAGGGLGDPDGGTTALLPVELLGAESDPGGDLGPAARRRAFDRVAAALVERGGGRPVLVVLDDLPWADRGTVALLRHLVTGHRAGSIAVLATGRSTTDWPPWVVGLCQQATSEEALVTRELAPLPVTAVAELAASLGSDDDPVVLRAATGGNPLLIRQLRGRATAAGGGEQRWGALALVLGQRMAGLSPGTRALLDAAALAGTTFDVVVVAGAAGRDVPDALDRLDEARRVRLVEPGPGPSRFAFAHDVVREYLADQVPPSRRLALHAGLGRALERAGGEASSIAHHYRAAAPALGAALAAERVATAADRARQRLAYEDAADLYRVAADLVAPQPGVGDEQWEQITLRRAAALFDAGDPPAARAAALEVADAARRRGDPVRLAEAAIAHQGRWVPTAAGPDGDDRAMLADARSLLGETGPLALRARLDARLALADFHRGGDGPATAARAAAAVEQARASGDPRALTEALTVRHTTAALELAPGSRLALCDELRVAASRLGDAETLANSYAAAALDRLAAGDPTGAAAELARFDRHADATGSATLRWRREVLAATFALADGHFDDADRSTARALELGTELNQAEATFAWAAQTFVSSWLRWGAATVVEAAADLAARHPEVPAWGAAHALALADAGRLEAATGHVARFTADGLDAVPRDLLWMATLLTAAEAAVRCRHRPSAGPLIERLAPHTGTVALVGAGVSVLGPVDRVLGLLHDLDGRPADARRHLDRALDVAGPQGLAPFRALTLLARAEVAARTGDPGARAAADAAEAGQLAQRLGLAAVAGAAALAPPAPSD